MDRWRLFALIDALEGDLRAALQEWVLPFKELKEALGSRYEIVRQRASDDGTIDLEAQIVNYVDFHDAFALTARAKALAAIVNQAAR